MKGIHPDLCTHHIYIKEGSRPIHQPQHQDEPDNERHSQRRATEIAYN
jgi:hypothetical protein